MSGSTLSSSVTDEFQTKLMYFPDTKYKDVYLSIQVQCIIITVHLLNTIRKYTVIKVNINSTAGIIATIVVQQYIPCTYMLSSYCYFKIYKLQFFNRLYC